MGMNRGSDQLHIAVQTTPMTEMKRQKHHAALDISEFLDGYTAGSIGVLGCGVSVVHLPELPMMR